MGVTVNDWIVETYLVPWILDGLPNKRAAGLESDPGREEIP